MHVPHAEDLPNTATAANSARFFIRPFNYFDEDPSIGSTNAILITPIEPYNFSAQKVERYGTPVGPQCIPKKHTTDFKGTYWWTTVFCCCCCCYYFCFFFLLFVLFGTVCLRICRVTLLSEVDQFIIYQSQKLPPNCKNVETLWRKSAFSDFIWRLIRMLVKKKNQEVLPCTWYCLYQHCKRGVRGYNMLDHMVNTFLFSNVSTTFATGYTFIL